MSTAYMPRAGEGRFRVSDEGIFNPLWGIGTLEWNEIRDVFAKRDGAHIYVCVVVKDREALKARLGFLRRLFHRAANATGFGDLTIDVARIGLSAEELVRFAAVKLNSGMDRKP